LIPHLNDNKLPSLRKSPRQISSFLPSSHNPLCVWKLKEYLRDVFPFDANWQRGDVIESAHHLEGYVT
jgi:hypothetical protein